MLMVTVMAFATDYKGQLDFAIKINSSFGFRLQAV